MFYFEIINLLASNFYIRFFLSLFIFSLLARINNDIFIFILKDFYYKLQ